MKNKVNKNEIIRVLVDTEEFLGKIIDKFKGQELKELQDISENIGWLKAAIILLGIQGKHGEWQKGKISSSKGETK